MSELKIKTHTTYTYETTDGREFDDATEAQEWQEYLGIIKNITMLNFKFEVTDDAETAIYVHIKNWEQQEAFTAIQNYYGYCATIPEPGYWYYDDCTDSYIDVIKERDNLQNIIESLSNSGKREN